MLELIMFVSIVAGIASFFVANMLTYKTDIAVVNEHFKKRGEEVLQIKDSFEYSFKHKEILKRIEEKSRMKSSKLISRSGPLLRKSFYLVTTSKNETIELYITNSLMFFIKPKLYSSSIV